MPPLREMIVGQIRAVSDMSVFEPLDDETGTERRLSSGPDGRYSAPSIPVGNYTVSAHADGFADERRTGVPLSVVQSQIVDLTLAVNGGAQSITVEDHPPIVNTSTQQISGLVTEFDDNIYPKETAAFSTPRTDSATPSKSSGIVGTIEGLSTAGCQIAAKATGVGAVGKVCEYTPINIALKAGPTVVAITKDVVGAPVAGVKAVGHVLSSIF